MTAISGWPPRGGVTQYLDESDDAHWGTLIEGHGGMLDRLDSVCFAAPIFFHLVRYGWT